MATRYLRATFTFISRYARVTICWSVTLRVTPICASGLRLRPSRQSFLCALPSLARIPTPLLLPPKQPHIHLLHKPPKTVLCIHLLHRPTVTHSSAALTSKKRGSTAQPADEHLPPQSCASIFKTPFYMKSWKLPSSTPTFFFSPSKLPSSTIQFENYRLHQP